MTAIGRATVIQEPPVIDDDVPGFGWWLLCALRSLLPLAVLLGLVVGGLALAGALGVG